MISENAALCYTGHVANTAFSSILKQQKCTCHFWVCNSHISYRDSSWHPQDITAVFCSTRKNHAKWLGRSFQCCNSALLKINTPQWKTYGSFLVKSNAARCESVCVCILTINVAYTKKYLNVRKLLGHDNSRCASTSNHQLLKTHTLIITIC